MELNRKEKELRTLIEKHGFSKFLLIAQAEGSRVRPPPKNRYAPAPPLRPAPSFLVLVHSELDDLIEGLDPKSLQKTGSLVRYLLKQIKNRVKETNDESGT